jgi:hypothetical protein
MSERQIETRRQRIHTLCNLETISRKVSAAISEMDAGRRQHMAKVL